MYKSSSLTVIFKYFFPVFMLAGVIFGIYLSWTEGTPESQGFAKGFAIIAVWISIFLVQMPFRLKNIETTEKGILIKEFKQDLLVEYRDLQWISMFDLTSPWGITIKYHDKNSGIDKKVSFMPSQSNKSSFGKDPMTKYIHDKIKTHNPNYSEETQPSPIKNILIITLLSLPFLFLYLYFSGFLDNSFK